MDTADPHNLHDTADHAVIRTAQIATAGLHCDECVEKLRTPLMGIEGVQDVNVDLQAQLVTIRFDARKTDPPALHEAILRSGYQPAPLAG
jgi:copper chaperone CopZ